MLGGLNWELKGWAVVLEAGLKVAGLNWFVCMNCCCVTMVAEALLVTCLFGWMEVRVSGAGDTNCTLGLKGWGEAL